MCCELIVHSASVIHQMWCKSNEPSWCPIIKSDIPQSVTSSRVKVPYILTDRLTDFSGDESDGFLVRSCLGVCVFLLNTCIIGETISLPSNWESAAMSYPLVQLSANKWCERVCARCSAAVSRPRCEWHQWRGRTFKPSRNVSNDLTASRDASKNLPELLDTSRSNVQQSPL